MNTQEDTMTLDQTTCRKALWGGTVVVSGFATGALIAWLGLVFLAATLP